MQLIGSGSNVYLFVRPATVGWTLLEHARIVQVGRSMSAGVEIGRADDGAPWAVLEAPGGMFSFVRENGVVAVLDSEGREVVKAASVERAAVAFEATWWASEQRRRAG